jgi:hypothetical protein
MPFGINRVDEGDGGEVIFHSMPLYESVTSLRFVTISKFAEGTGYSEKAIRRKIEDGIFVEKLHYFRAPDGRILFDTEAYQRWVQGMS